MATYLNLIYYSYHTPQTFSYLHIKGIVYWEALLMPIIWNAGNALWIIIPECGIRWMMKGLIFPEFSVRKLWTLHLTGEIIFSCFIQLHYLQGISPELVFSTNIILYWPQMLCRFHWWSPVLSHSPYWCEMYIKPIETIYDDPRGVYKHQQPRGSM